MYLEDFFSYKTELMKTLCSTEEIVRLITDDETAAVPNKSLMYKNVFPFEYVPDTVQKGDTFVCYDVDVTSVDGTTFLNSVLYVWVFTHKSKLRMPDGSGARLDVLSSRIDRILNRSRLFGLGELRLFRVGRFVPADDFYGRSLAYRLREFNAPKGFRGRPARRGT